MGQSLSYQQLRGDTPESSATFNFWCQSAGQGEKSGGAAYCRHCEQPGAETITPYTENWPSSPKPLMGLKNNQLIMARDSQEIPTTKRNKRKALTLENYYKEKIQSTEEAGEEDKHATMPKPPHQNQKW